MPEETKNISLEGTMGSFKGIDVPLGSTDEEIAAIVAQGNLQGPTVLSSEAGKETIDQIREVIAPDDVVEEEVAPTIEETLLQQDLDEGKDESTLRFEEREKEVNIFFKTQQKNLNTSRRRQLANISSQYSAFTRSIEKSTKRRTRLQETIGARFGGRFTIEHTADLVKEQVDLGIQALEDLFVKENVAKGRIEDAFDAKSHALALKSFQELNTIRAEKEKKFDEIEKMQQEALALQQEEDKKLANQELIAGELEKGLTNAVDIFSALGGDVSFDEILNITKELNLDAGEAFTLGEKAIRFDAEGKVIARGSGVGGAPVSVTGVGASTAGISSAGGRDFPTDADIKAMNTEERDFVNKVIRQLPTKLKDSILEKAERQKEALFDFWRGRKIQEVVDEINGFIIQNTADAPIASVFRRLSIGTGLELSEISAALNNNDPIKAMTTVENANLEKAEGELSEVVSAQSIIKNSNRALELLKTAPLDKLGAFDGRVFKITKLKELTDSETAKTQQLETALVNLLNEIRRKSLGTAVTQSEVQFLEPLLASILDQPGIIKTKLDELKVGTVNNHNRARAVTGLPEVTETQLLDNEERLGLYESLAEANIISEFSGLSNEELSAEIDRELGGGGTGTTTSFDVDINGFPIF